MDDGCIDVTPMKSRLPKIPKQHAIPIATQCSKAVPRLACEYSWDCGNNLSKIMNPHEHVEQLGLIQVNTTERESAKMVTDMQQTRESSLFFVMFSTAKNHVARLAP